MFYAIAFAHDGDIYYESVTFESYEELIRTLLDEEVLIELDELYAYDDYWRVIVYEIGGELTDDMEYAIFYPIDEDD